MTLTGFGVTLQPLSGWSARIFNHAGDPDSDNRPTVQLATFPLPIDSTDYGSTAISTMGGRDAFIALVEYTPDCYLPGPDTLQLDPTIGAFADVGIPRLTVDLFDPAGVHGGTPPQNATASQVAFSLGGRPFAIYSVIGDVLQVPIRLPEILSTVLSLTVTPVVYVDFSASLTLVPSAPIAGNASSGVVAGGGSGTAKIWQGDGISSQNSNVALTLGAGVYENDPSTGQMTMTGVLDCVLANLQIAAVSVNIVVPNLDPSQPQPLVGDLFVNADPVGLPVAVTITNTDNNVVSAIDIASTFVIPANALIG